jgi:cystine transport system substrate-binding protein
MSLLMPYAAQDLRIRVRQKNADIVDSATLKDRKVGVSAGTTSEMCARRSLPAAEIGACDGDGFVFDDWSNGRIDAIVASFFNGPV